MKKIFSLGVLAATLAVGSACSQEEIVATYKDGKITKKEVIENYADQYNLDIEEARTKYNNFGIDQKKALIDHQLTEKIILAEAEKAKISNSTEYQRKLESFKKNLLTQLLIDQKIASKISEAQIDEEYNAIKKQFEAQKEYKFRIITNNDKSKINEAYDKLAKGRKFEDIASEYDYYGGENGGLMAGGQYIRDEQLNETLFNTLSNLQSGKYSKPFKYEGKWAIISLVNKRNVEVPPKENIRDQLKQRITMDKFSSYVESLKEEYNADVKIEGANDNKSSESQNKQTNQSSSENSNSQQSSDNKQQNSETSKAKEHSESEK